MPIIRSKKEAEQFIDAFDQSARWDALGSKHYFVFIDRNRGGQWTLMAYRDGTWTLHGRGETYCDSGERTLSREEACELVWKERAAVNRSLSTTK